MFHAYIENLFVMVMAKIACDAEKINFHMLYPVAILVLKYLLLVVYQLSRVNASFYYEVNRQLAVQWRQWHKREDKLEPVA